MMVDFAAIHLGVTLDARDRQRLSNMLLPLYQQAQKIESTFTFALAVRGTMPTQGSAAFQTIIEGEKAKLDMISHINIQVQQIVVAFLPQYALRHTSDPVEIT